MPTPGAPFPFGRQPAELVMNEVGDLDEGDGAKVSLVGSKVVFRCAGNGADFLFAIEVTDLLASIEEYNGMHES